MRRKRQAIIRIAFATLIAIFISAPIDIRLFSPKISRQLLDDRQSEMKADQLFYNRQYGVIRLQSELNKDQGTLNADANLLWHDPPGALFKNRLRDLRAAQSDWRRINIYASRVLPPMILQVRNIRNRVRKIDQEWQRSTAPSLVELRTMLVNQRKAIDSRIAVIRSEQHNANERLYAVQRTVNRLRDEYHNELTKYIATLRSRISTLTTSSSSAVARADAKVRKADMITSNAYSGNLISEIEAMGELTRQPFTTLWWTRILTFLFIWSMETAPILTKLLLTRGPYEAAVEAAEMESICDSDAKAKFLASTKAVELFTGLYEADIRQVAELKTARRAREFAKSLEDECLRFHTDWLEFAAKLAEQQKTEFSLDEKFSALDSMAKQFWSVIEEVTKQK